MIYIYMIYTYMYIYTDFMEIHGDFMGSRVDNENPDTTGALKISRQFAKMAGG